MRATWDIKKAAANLKNHGVSFTEALTAFNDRSGLYEPDKDFPERGNLIAYSVENRMLFVVYLEFDPEKLFTRIISARKPSKQERQRYEENFQSLL